MSFPLEDGKVNRITSVGYHRASYAPQSWENGVSYLVCTFDSRTETNMRQCSEPDARNTLPKYCSG